MATLLQWYIGAECGRIVKKKHIFDYYVSHNDATRAVCFLTSETPPIENPAPCPAYIISLCSSVFNSTAFLYNTILDDLAR